MARVSKPLILSEADLMALEKLKAYGDKEESLRAGIVIASADDRTNKSIAQELSVNEATVRKWKEAFREKGLQGLASEHTGGRRSSSPKPDALEQTVLDMVAGSGDEGLTASAIAERLRVDAGKVYYVLRKNGITLSRNRSWEYIPGDDMGGWNPPVVCLYLSSSFGCIVASSEPCRKESGRMQGVFVTRDKALKNALERSLVPVSLPGILKTASGIPAGASAKDPGPGQVIEEAISQWDAEGEAEFYIFCFGGPFSYEGIRSKQSHVLRHGSPDEMKASFLHWMGGRCDAAQHVKAELLLGEVCRFCGQRRESSRGFVWYLRRNEAAHGEGGTEAAPGALGESGDTLVLPGAESWGTVEEMLKKLLPEMDSGEPEAGAILYHRGKDGKIHCSHVQSSQRFQGMEEFDFESRKGFERDLSRLEDDTEGLLHEIAGANYEMYLAGAKKNKA